MEREYFNSVEEGLKDLKSGKPVVLMDSTGRENEGDVIVAAEFADAKAINFMATHARGLICIAMTPERLEQLHITLMKKHQPNQSEFQSPFTVSVDAAQGITTGISAADRAQTVKVLISGETRARDLVSPGHLFPLKAHPQGLVARQGHTEASVQLMKQAGLYPAAVICEVMNADGTMARLADLKLFAAKHGLKLISIEQLKEYRPFPKTDRNYCTSGTAVVPTPFGIGRMKAFADHNGREHLVIRYGTPGDNPLVRIHSECLTGDVFGSLRCDCGEQLKAAQARIAAEGAGIIIYLRQEGRGIGLCNKLNAYALQEKGFDTVEANVHLGFASDERDYRIAAEILREMKLYSIRLLTNNPQKIQDLEKNGVSVSERIPLQIKAREENRRYLETKRIKMNHLLSEELLQIK